VLTLASVANYRAPRWIPLRGSERLWARFIKAGHLLSRRRLYRLYRGTSPPNTPPLNLPIPPFKSPPLALQNPSAIEPDCAPNVSTNVFTNVCTNAYTNAYTNACTNAYTNACTNACTNAYIKPFIRPSKTSPNTSPPRV
jgi:hypothetical protein